MSVGPPAVLRVLSYNVHRWGDDRAALARVVKACSPDVMLVQEAPTWWGTERMRQAMAASFGMRYVVGSARNTILVADGIEVTDALHCGLPYLLTGDLNEEPGGPIWKRLADEGLTDLGADAGPTFSSSNPYKRIDGAHLSPDLPGRVIPLPAVPQDLAAASDHLPILIELTA